MGDRYGIEPNGGNPPVFELRQMIRIGEEIIEWALQPHASVVPR
jgi:hypothetical protein